MPRYRLIMLILLSALVRWTVEAQVEVKWQGVFTNAAIKDMVYDGTGNVIAAARLVQTTPTFQDDLQVAKFSSNGTRLWMYEAPGLGSFSLAPGILSVDPYGNVFIIAQTNQSRTWLLH